MSLLFKTLRDIKSSFGISKRSDLPITIFHQIYLVLQPSRYMNMNSSMLWATFTIAFSRFLHSSEFTSGGTFDAQIHLTRLEVSFYPDLLQPDYFKTVFKKSKTDPFLGDSQVHYSQIKLTHMCCLLLHQETTSRQVHIQLLSLCSSSQIYSGYLTRSSFTHNIYGPC